MAQEIPTVVIPIIESYGYIGTGRLGEMPGDIKDGSFTIRPRKLDDGSLLQSTNHARKTIRTILGKNGTEKELIDAAIAKFERAPSDVTMELTPELKVAKWTTESVKPDHSQIHLMNPLVPAKIAFEFFALIVDKAIYVEHKGLLETKRCFQKMAMTDDVIKVERFLAEKPKPFHGILFEGNGPHMKIQVRLFGAVVYRVHFALIELNLSKLAYNHNLVTNKHDLKLFED